MFTRLQRRRAAQRCAVCLHHLLAPLLLCAAGAAHAELHPWTTVGSAGVVDEADTGIVEFVLGEARGPATAAAGSVLNLRYNVVSLEGFSGPGQYLMRVRLRDNGPAARVQLNLRRYNLDGPSTELLPAPFDSNDHPPQVGYQTQERCVLIDWNFHAGAHYFDATLTKSAAGGQPALGIIQLVAGNCVP